MVKAILSRKDRLYQHGFIVHDDGGNVNFSRLKMRNAAAKNRRREREYGSERRFARRSGFRRGHFRRNDCRFGRGGFRLGAAVGAGEGDSVGAAVGSGEGDSVGAAVGSGEEIRSARPLVQGKGFRSAQLSVQGKEFRLAQLSVRGKGFPSVQLSASSVGRSTTTGGVHTWPSAASRVISSGDGWFKGQSSGRRASGFHDPFGLAWERCTPNPDTSRRSDSLRARLGSGRGIGRDGATVRGATVSAHCVS